MKIKIDDITDNGLTVTLAEDGAKISHLAEGGLDYTILSPVTGQLDFVKNDGNVFVNGNISARLRFACSRCLKEIDLPVDTDVTLYYERGRDEDRDKEIKPSEVDVNRFPGEEFDTDEIILAQVALDAPIQPLCDPECKGLCLKCGADLNEGECGCTREGHGETKFAKLKDFKVK